MFRSKLFVVGLVLALVVTMAMADEDDDVQAKTKGDALKLCKESLSRATGVQITRLKETCDEIETMSDKEFQDFLARKKIEAGK